MSFKHIINQKSKDLAIEICDFLKREEKTKKQFSKLQREKLELSVKTLLIDSLCAYASHPFAPVKISKRPKTYSSNHHEYKGLSFRMHIKWAYPALIQMGYLKRLQAGFYDRTKKSGQRETYRITEKLLAFLDLDGQSKTTKSERLDWTYSLIVSPDFAPQPAPVQISYRDPKTKARTIYLPKESRELEEVCKRLEQINQSISMNWIDLELTENEWGELSQGWSDKKGRFHTLRLNKRYLYRIFHDAQLKTGGRLYGGWWQEIPSKYRPSIVIDGKRTVELDFSGLHPSILYAKRGLTPPEESYSQVAGEEYREIIKDCFSAMLNAKHRITQPLRHTDIRPTKLKWKEIVGRIIEFHKPISDAFFSGSGLWLMKEDSDLAEQVLLHFAKLGYPALPIHDSFIVHHGLETDLLRVMEREFELKYSVVPNIKITKKNYLRDRKTDTVDKYGNINVETIFDSLNKPQERRLTEFQTQQRKLI